MIHTVTLNPAIDKLLFLPDFKKNVTNRLCLDNDSIGGKGTHVSINLKALGIDNTAFGIAFGETGAKIIKMLEQNNVDVKFLYKEEQNSRTNYLVIEDNGNCSTLASRGVLLEKDIIDEFISLLLENLKENDSLILSGDTSNCFDSCVYNYILNALRERKIKVFLDASGPSLKECLKESPFLIKPNLDELSQLCGHNLESMPEIISAIESLSQYNIEIIAVSMGGDGSLVKTPEGIYQITPPDIVVRNTIGCGDCYLSGLIYGIEMKYPIEKTLKLATAISAATAESEYSVGFNLQRAGELEQKVEITKIR